MLGLTALDIDERYWTAFKQYYIIKHYYNIMVYKIKVNSASKELISKLNNPQAKQPLKGY